jgi:hypothetical protein
MLSHGLAYANNLAVHVPRCISANRLFSPAMPQNAEFYDYELSLVTWRSKIRLLLMPIRTSEEGRSRTALTPRAKPIRYVCLVNATSIWIQRSCSELSIPLPRPILVDMNTYVSGMPPEPGSRARNCPSFFRYIVPRSYCPVRYFLFLPHSKAPPFKINIRDFRFLPPRQNQTDRCSHAESFTRYPFDSIRDY